MGAATRREPRRPAAIVVAARSTHASGALAPRDGCECTGNGASVRQGATERPFVVSVTTIEQPGLADRFNL